MTARINGGTPFPVICRQGFEPIYKVTDSSPVCVRSETAEELIDRGWAIIAPTKWRIQLMTNNSEYMIGAVIKLTILNMRDKTIYFSSGEWGLSITDPEGKIMRNCLSYEQAVSHLVPNSKITITWDTVNDCPDEKLLPGIYEIGVRYSLDTNFKETFGERKSIQIIS